MTKLNENSVFFLGLVTVAEIDNKNVFSLVLGTSPKSILHILVNVASLDLNSVVSLVWTSKTLFNLGQFQQNQRVFLFFWSMWLKLMKTVGFR